MNHTPFIRFLLAHHALKFGQFTLKSGRISPYFFQLGECHSGKTLYQLGLFYAEALIQSGIAFDGLWAAPYKGIPIATATAIALAQQYQHPTEVASYRKERKAHGEGGYRMGAPLEGRFVFIDDVITAGTACQDAFTQFDQENQGKGELVAMVVALDREERKNPSFKTPEIPCIALATLTEILTYIEQDPRYAEQKKAILDYRKAS